MTTKSIADEFVEVAGLIAHLTDDITNEHAYRHSVRNTQQAAWNALSNGIREAREICGIAYCIKLDAKQDQKP